MITSFTKQQCIACDAPLTEDLVHIGSQYPSAVYPSVEANYRSFLQSTSLNLSRCSQDDCGLAQLSIQSNLDYVLEHYPYVSGTTASMKQILADVVHSMETIAPFSEEDVILDIGGNDGTLLNLIQKPVKARVNIDAAHGIPSVLDDPDYTKIQSKFAASVYEELNLPAPKAIFSTAMFYHLSTPREFCEEVKKVMNDDTIWCIQMTYLGSMLESNIYDNIVHEHVAYYSLHSLEFLMKQVGLEICEAQIVDCYGGSIRAYVMKNADRFPKTHFRKHYTALQKEELDKGINTPEALVRFNDRIGLIRDVTRGLVSHGVDQIGKIVALGASTKGNMICQFIGASQDQIECVLDNNEKKIGLITTGSDIPIVDEQQYLTKLPQYVLLLPYYYKEFFISLIQKYLAKGQTIYLILPLPTPHFLKVQGKG